MRAYIDSDVLIWHLRGNQKALNFLEKFSKKAEYELWIGALQRAEITFFIRSGEEKKIQFLLSQFKTASVDQTIVDKTAQLYRKWHPSHGIDVNDALLAAIALQSGGVIFCLNQKHYPMPEIIVKKAWPT